MHIRPVQINPNAQLDALYASEKATAKREAANIRKKLFEFASELAGESDSEEACVVKLGPREESQGAEKQQNHAGGKKHKKEPDSEDGNDVISDWA